MFRRLGVWVSLLWLGGVSVPRTAGAFVLIVSPTEDASMGEEGTMQGAGVALEGDLVQAGERVVRVELSDTSDPIPAIRTAIADARRRGLIGPDESLTQIHSLGHGNEETICLGGHRYSTDLRERDVTDHMLTLAGFFGEIIADGGEVHLWHCWTACPQTDDDPHDVEDLELTIEDRTEEIEGLEARIASGECPPERLERYTCRLGEARAEREAAEMDLRQHQACDGSFAEELSSALDGRQITVFGLDCICTFGTVTPPFPEDGPGHVFRYVDGQLVQAEDEQSGSDE